MHVCIDHTVVFVLNDITYKVTFQFIKNLCRNSVKDILILKRKDHRYISFCSSYHIYIYLHDYTRTIGG